MSEVQPVPEPDELKVTFLDDKLKISGEADDLERIKKLMDGSREFSLETDSIGNLLLVKKEAVTPKTLDTEEQIFFIVEDMPEFPGGEPELRKFIANNIEYPAIAQEKGIQGRVYVTFVVDKNGEVANARIARGVDPSLDKEALRVVNSLPKWTPGKQRGEAVNVSYTVPINFALQ
jgi:TonB family protein